MGELIMGKEQCGLCGVWFPKEFLYRHYNKYRKDVLIDTIREVMEKLNEK